MGVIERLEKSAAVNQEKADKFLKEETMRNYHTGITYGELRGAIRVLKNIISGLQACSQCMSCGKKFKVILDEPHKCGKCWKEWDIEPVHIEK